MKSLENMDQSLEFYKSTMDSLHLYLYHLFDVGLRVRSNDDQKDQSGSEISPVNEAVKKGKEISKSFARFKSNSKFNITTGKLSK